MSTQAADPEPDPKPGIGITGLSVEHETGLTLEALAAFVRHALSAGLDPATPIKARLVGFRGRIKRLETVAPTPAKAPKG